MDFEVFVFKIILAKRFFTNWCGPNILNRAMKSVMRVNFMSFKGVAS
jgi:hypothetical protein